MTNEPSTKYIVSPTLSWPCYNIRDTSVEDACNIIAKVVDEDVAQKLCKFLNESEESK